MQITCAITPSPTSARDGARCARRPLQRGGTGGGRLTETWLHEIKQTHAANTQVLAVQLDQVEGVEEHPVVKAAIADAVEARHAVIAAADRASLSMMQERERSRTSDATIRAKR
jgi:hypothetical protein